MESWIIVSSKDDLRTETAQSLSNWRTRGNCRDDGAHEILEEAAAVSTELFSDETGAYFFQGTMTDGSLPRDALLQSPQSTNDSGACTPPLFYHGQIAFRFTFAANKTQLGELSECQLAMISTPTVQFRWNCVQLKQQIERPENDGNWTLSPSPRADYQMRTEPGVIRKNS